MRTSDNFDYSALQKRQTQKINVFSINAADVDLYCDFIQRQQVYMTKPGIRIVVHGSSCMLKYSKYSLSQPKLKLSK